MSSTMSWLVLLAAGLFEIGWAVGLKAAQGRLSDPGGDRRGDDRQRRAALRRDAELPLGTSYAVWTGIGAVGTVLVGIVDVRRIRRRRALALHRADPRRHRSG